MDQNQVPQSQQKNPEVKVGLKELEVNIVSADDNVFDGTVRMLTSKNDDGEFDILPLHANFISIIKEKIILHKTTKEKQDIPITNGVLKVVENRVDIILGPFVGADILPANMAPKAQTPEKEVASSEFQSKVGKNNGDNSVKKESSKEEEPKK